MKIAVFKDVEKIEIEEVNDLQLAPHQVLIKVDCCAICTWEQRVYTGVKKVEFPFVGGHEIAATIVQLGDAIDTTHWSIGDKVVYGTYLACGECYYCKTGDEQNCTHFNHNKHIEGTNFRGMGGFSEYLIAETKHLFKYQNITPEEACICEPLSCCIHSVNSANIHFKDFTAVVGCGIMGQLHIQLAALKGASVIAIDVNDERLALAKKLGATHIINSAKENAYDTVMALTNGLGAQVIFNTTPISAVASECLTYLAIKGRLVLYSSYYPDVPISISLDTIHKKAQQILGTANSNSHDFMEATQLLSEGIIDLKPFISGVYPLSEIDKALQSSAKGDKFRNIIKFD